MYLPAVNRKLKVDLVDLLFRNRLDALVPEGEFRLTFRATPHARECWGINGLKGQPQEGHGDTLLFGETDSTRSGATTLRRQRRPHCRAGSVCAPSL